MYGFVNRNFGVLQLQLLHKQYGFAFCLGTIAPMCDILTLVPRLLFLLILDLSKLDCFVHNGMLHPLPYIATVLFLVSVPLSSLVACTIGGKCRMSVVPELCFFLWSPVVQHRRRFPWYHGRILRYFCRVQLTYLSTGFVACLLVDPPLRG